jgi:hypothetical protein
MPRAWRHPRDTRRIEYRLYYHHLNGHWCSASFDRKRDAMNARRALAPDADVRLVTVEIIESNLIAKKI